MKRAVDSQHEGGPATLERPGPDTDEGTVDARDTVQPGAAMSAPFERTRYPGIYQRGSRYVVMYRDPQGKQRKRSAATLAEARRVQAEVSADKARGEYRPAAKETFGAYARTWIETYQGRTRRGVRPETLADYRDELERFAIPALGALRMSEVEPRHIKALIAKVGEGRRPNTVRLALAPVKALFATALEDGLIRTNPAAGVRIAQPTTLDEDDDDAVQIKALTREQLAGLLAEIDPDYAAFVTFVAQTGLRISEAVAVRWSDVDLGRRELYVRRRFRTGRYAPPKSRYGRRSIPLAPGMARLLWQRQASERPQASALVWPNEVGKPLDADNLRRRVLKPAAERAGIPWAGWHTLRHTCGTLLVREGWPVTAVQRFLGHHSAAFTLAVYVSFFPEDMPAADFLDELVAPGAGGNAVGTTPTDTTQHHEASPAGESIA